MSRWSLYRFNRGVQGDYIAPANDLCSRRRCRAISQAELTIEMIGVGVSCVIEKGGADDRDCGCVPQHAGNQRLEVPSQRPPPRGGRAEQDAFRPTSSRQPWGGEKSRPDAIRGAPGFGCLNDRWWRVSGIPEMTLTTAGR